MLTVQRVTLTRWTRGRKNKVANKVMDNEVNEINDIDRARLQNKEDVNVHENKPDSFPNFLDGNNNAWVSTSERACSSPRCLESPGVMVEELTIRNLNNGQLEIVGASNPDVRDDSNSLSFSEFLDKKQEDRNKNETADNLSLEEKQLSPGGIRTKILSKSGFSEYFVKNTLKGKGVVFRGPAQDGLGVHIRGQSDSRDIPIPEPRTSVSSHSEGISLREWLNGGRNKVEKSRSLYIFKQILDLVDSSHSQGVALQALRPSCFRLLPSNSVLYLGSPAQKEVPEIHHLDNRDSKKRKYGENWKSFGRWPQFPNRSGSVHGTSHSVKPQIGGPRASGHGSNEESVVSGGNLLEEQWYASPEELRERSSTLSSNIYALGVLLFELLGSFESTREHAIAMMHLRQRILPPSFLSENPKEAGYCLWLLHPEAPARPTTRDILKSKLVSDIEEISTDKLLASIAQEDMDSDLLLHFLESLKEHKQKCATKLVKDINCIEFDITEIESRRSDNITFDTNTTMSPLLTTVKSNLIKSNLDHLESAYFLVRSSIEVPVSDATDFSDHKVLTSRESYQGTQNVEASKEPVDRLGIFFNGLCKYARFSKFEVRGNLRSGDFSSAANVICSLGFDRDEDYFATAGVSKKIKVYDYHLLLDDSVDIHYPAVEMPNNSKLTCICWNSYIKNYLASTDYDGIVKLWDVGSGQTVSHHIEHERRAWSVDFSKVDPTKLASGSDDCYVKLWSINEKNSLSTIRTIANVCCVQLSPYSAHLLSFGSSDYRTYCYDMRNISTPLCILAGHDRAVSYVKFLDSETIASASTDNTLKLWDLKKASFGCLSTDACVLTYKGHTNEKNFVGLSVADGYIACGSETNEVFAYYRSLPMPITSHNFGSIDPISGKETDHANNQFVSSVCWRQKSDMVIAANSSGCLKLLQMV